MISVAEAPLSTATFIERALIVFSDAIVVWELLVYIVGAGRCAPS
jgi:hypothetical protein